MRMKSAQQTVASRHPGNGSPRPRRSSSTNSTTVSRRRPVVILFATVTDAVSAPLARALLPLLPRDADGPREAPGVGSDVAVLFEALEDSRRLVVGDAELALQLRQRDRLQPQDQLDGPDERSAVLLGRVGEE